MVFNATYTFRCEDSLETFLHDLYDNNPDISDLLVTRDKKVIKFSTTDEESYRKTDDMAFRWAGSIKTALVEFD